MYSILNGAIPLSMTRNTVQIGLCFFNKLPTSTSVSPEEPDNSYIETLTFQIWDNLTVYLLGLTLFQILLFVNFP